MMRNRSLSKKSIWMEVCSLLGQGPLESSQLHKFSNDEWLALIEISNEEFVSAEISECFAEIQGIPQDIREYFEVIRSANLTRNNQILEQCREIAYICGRNNIIFLKGTSWLVEKSPYMNRMMRDIDVLVSADQVADLEKLLISNGYKVMESYMVGDSYHRRPLIAADHCASVELHTEVSYWPDLLPAQEIFQNAILTPESFKIPSLQHRILHNTIHAQKSNGDWLGGKISFRDILDLKRLLLADVNQEIDWEDFANQCKKSNTFNILASALYCANGFLNAPLPKPFAKSKIGKWHVYRCSFQKNMPLGDTFQFLGILGRALRWERDAYALSLLGKDTITEVYKMRLTRIMRRLRCYLNK